MTFVFIRFRRERPEPIPLDLETSPCQHLIFIEGESAPKWGTLEFGMTDGIDNKEADAQGSSSLRHGKNMATGSIPRHLITFALPMLAGSLLQTAYSFINAIWVGQFLGKSALAAITVSFPVVFVLIALGAGLTMATNIQISQHWGARDLPSVLRVVNNSSVLLLVLGIGLTIIGELLTPAILRAMGTPPDVLSLAIHYMRIFLIGLPLGFGLFLVRSMLQGIGDSTTALYYLAGSVVFNTILDPVLMFGWLGFPALGLNGTAYASVIAQGMALGALIIMLRKRKNPVAPIIDLKQLDWHTTWTTIRIGIPSAIQQSLVSVGMVFITGIVNSFGESATAAFGAASRVDQLAFMPALTFSMAIATLSGQNIGANRHDRVNEVFKWGCILSGGITVLISILVVSWPRGLLRIFTNDALVIDIGAEYLRIVGSCYVFFAIMFVSNGIINGAGHTPITTLISLIGQWVVRVPLAYGLSRHMGDIKGVWIAIATGFAVAMLTSLSYYFSGRWRKPAMKRHAIAITPDAVFGEETGEA